MVPTRDSSDLLICDSNRLLDRQQGGVRCRSLTLAPATHFSDFPLHSTAGLGFATLRVDLELTTLQSKPT